MRKLALTIVLFCLLLPVASAIIPYVTNSWKESYNTVVSGIPNHMRLPFIIVGIVELEYVMQTQVESKNIEDVVIVINRYGNISSDYKPVSAPVQNIWYINATVRTPASFSSVNVTFRVQYDWLKKNNISEKNLTVYRYAAKDKVEAMPTIHVEDDFTAAQGKLAIMRASIPGSGLYIVSASGTDIYVAPPPPPPKAPDCDEEWTCEYWSACANKTQTRACNETTKCGTQKKKPATQQNCEEEAAIITTNATGPNKTDSNVTETLVNSTANVTTNNATIVPQSSTDWKARAITQATSAWKILTGSPRARIISLSVGILIAIALLTLVTAGLWKGVSAWREHRQLSREFDRRVEKLWERKKAKQKLTNDADSSDDNLDDTSSKADNKELDTEDTDSAPVTGRSLPGMPPKRK